MRKLTPYRLRDLFLVGSAVGIFIYILLRAINDSIVTDEDGSYFMFVTQGTIFPKKFDVFSANNHALNTALMWVMWKLFGDGQLSLRLPNVLAGGLYLFSIAMMVRRMPSPLVGAAAFVLATTSPFLIEYFGVARGYGLANGLIAFAFWQMWKYCDEGYRWKNLILVLIFSVLAVFANYTYLNLFLPLLGCAFLISLWQPGINDVSRMKRILQSGSSLFTILGALAIIIPISLKISAAGGFWPNTFQFFWKDSVASLILCSLMNVSDSNNLIQNIVLILQIITTLAFARILWWTFQQWRKKEFHLFPMVLLLVVTASAVSAVLQFQWLDTPMPIHRICLYFLWPWLLLVGVSASLPSKFNRWIVSTLLLIAGIQSALFVYSGSLEDNALRPPSVQVDDAISYLRGKVQGDGRLMLGFDQALFASGVAFYTHTLPTPEFDLTSEDLTMHPLNHYCLISRLYSGTIADNWVAEQTYLNGNVLYRNTRRPVLPTTTYEIELRRDTVKAHDGIPALLNIGGYIRDSIAAPIGTLIHINYDFVTTEESYCYCDIMILRGDKQIFMRRTDLFPDSRELMRGDIQVIIPQLHSGDCVLASFLTYPAIPVKLTTATMTIEAY